MEIDRHPHQNQEEPSLIEDFNFTHLTSASGSFFCYIFQVTNNCEENPPRVRMVWLGGSW